MKKPLKKLLTIVLAVTMLTGLISVTAFADDGNDGDCYAEKLAKYEEIMQAASEAAAVSYEPCAEVSAQVTNYTADGYEYNLNGDNKATIVGYIGKLTSITVPAKVDGYTVETIEQIWDDNITSITVSEGIKNIGECAFFMSASLTYLYLPKSIETIGFSFCSENYNMQTIDVNPANQYFLSENGILFNKAKDILICYPAGKTATNYTIPSTVKTIDGWAFSCASNLKSVTFPNGLETISLDAFEYCTSLTGLSFPNTLTEISLHAFSHCINLTSVVIPASVKFLSSDAFSYCSSLMAIDVNTGNTEYVSNDGILFSKDQSCMLTYPGGRENSFFSVPTGVSIIGSSAFAGNTFLKCIDLPNGLITINSSVFSDCTTLQDITIPQSVTSIGERAFKSCSSLTDVYYRGAAAQKANITIGDNNDQFINATWHYNCSDIFADVSTDEWFYQSVMFVNNKGIMTGLGGTNKFGPSQPLQREQFAIILWRLEDKPAAAYEAKFPDVPNGTWFTEPIMWAYKKGVITGYASGSFGVGDNITREQFATMLYRYAKNIRGIEMKNYADISTYPDAASVSDWAVEPMKWAVGNGIITGKQGGKYLDPAGNAQRCEGATMIQRFMTKFVPN